MLLDTGFKIKDSRVKTQITQYQLNKYYKSNLSTFCQSYK